jgi:DNA-binding HxlR family transcriptional regulator
MQDEEAIKLQRATRVLQLLQGKWTLEILFAMRDRPVRLSELRRVLPSASKKALTSSLRSLEAGGVVIRRDLSANLLHVEYSLSAATKASVIALLDHIIAWGAEYEDRLRRHSFGVESPAAIPKAMVRSW